jgi:GNAT superfamily N-acetyltransferase
MNDLLPIGYTARSARLEDITAAVDLRNAYSKAAMGAEIYRPDTMEHDWQSPGFNPTTDIRLVFAPQGELAGYCEVLDLNPPKATVSCWGCTHPQHTGKGIGAYLVKWAEQRSRQAIPLIPEGDRLSMLYFVLSSNRPAAQLFLNNGFELVRYSWRMVINLHQAPPEPQWPAGIRPRSFVPDQDERPAFAAGQEAFRDLWRHSQRPFEEAFQLWLHRVRYADGFDPSLFTLAMDGEEIAGICHCLAQARDDPHTAWIGHLSVRRPWRTRGLGLALLHNAFGQLYRRGIPRASLGVDAQSPTGAVRLYEKAGMHSDPTWEYSVYEKELRKE